MHNQKIVMYEGQGFPEESFCLFSSLFKTNSLQWNIPELFMYFYNVLGTTCLTHV